MKLLLDYGSNGLEVEFPGHHVGHDDVLIGHDPLRDTVDLGPSKGMPFERAPLQQDALIPSLEPVAASPTRAIGCLGTRSSARENAAWASAGRCCRSRSAPMAYHVLAAHSRA